jgi:hypothetical protein
MPCAEPQAQTVAALPAINARRDTETIRVSSTFGFCYFVFI